MMHGFWGALTLVIGGIIVADLVAHPTALYAGGTVLDNLARTTFGSLLGYNPNIKK
jgi:hypothetical protein